MTTNPLSLASVAVLKKNDRGNHTVPATGLYPHQWLWDSCFAAIGWAQIDTNRAEKEIFSLLRGQWSNGMIPHIIFDMSRQYQRERNMWRSWVASQSPKRLATSGITQPPIIAEAVSRIGAQMTKSERQQFYKKVLPALVRYHQWLYNERDPHQDGLVLQIHPHETGMDNTPPWIDQLREHSWPWWVSVIEKLHLEGIINFLRDDIRTMPKAQRTKNVDGMVCWDVVRRLRRKHYDIDLILHRSLFAIEDVSFNSIFIRNNSLLREIANEARIKLPIDLLTNMARSEKALESLWDNNFNLYLSRDFVTFQLLKEPTVASLLPLYAGTIDKTRADKLVKTMLNEHVFWLNHPVPSVPRNVVDFDAQRYWQGPTWINTNWLLIDGLTRMGYSNEAEALKSHTIEMMRENGIWEYYNPLTGKGLGSPNFSWSAALALDLLEQ